MEKHIIVNRRVSATLYKVIITYLTLLFSMK